MGETFYGNIYYGHEITRNHSLKAYPELTATGKPQASHRQATGKPQTYLSGVKDRKIITKFRLGDAGLGNRSSKPIKLCPMCKAGENNEPHLVFECPEVQSIRETLF